MIGVVRATAAALLGCHLVVVAVVLLNADPSLASDVIALTESAMPEQGSPRMVDLG